MIKPEPTIIKSGFVKKTVALSIALSLLGYIVHHYTPSINSLVSQQLDADWRYVIPAICFFFLHTMVVLFSWHYVLRAIGVKVTPAKAYIVFITSALARYLPGGIWHIGGRLYALTKSGAKASHVSLSLIIEQSTALIFCLLLALAFFMLTRSDAEQLSKFYYFGKQTIFPVVLILILIAYPKHLLWLLRKTMRIFKNEEAVTHIKYRTILYIYLLNSIALILYALGYYCCMLIYNSSPSFDFPYYASIVLMATFIGFVTPFVPGGMGVREAFLMLALSGIESSEILASVSILPRLLIILTEILMFAFSIILIMTKRHEIGK